MNTVWLVFYAALLVAYTIVAGKRGGLANPDGFFVLFNSIALLGTALLVSADGDATDERYFHLVLFSCAVYVFASMLVRLSIRPMTVARVAEDLKSVPITFLLPLYVLSAGVSIAYYLAVGHITLVDSLAAQVSGSSYDAATQRLASYAGSRYLFPGYVNQFKNALLPVLTLALIHRMWIMRLKYRLVISAALLLFMFVMVAGTGQRAALVIVLLAYAVTLRTARLMSGMRMALAGVGMLICFSFLTLLLGRNEAQLATASGSLGKLQVMSDAIWSRVVMENPSSGLAAFRYTEAIPPPRYWGAEWVADISGVLPGSRGSDLANRVFEMLYGTDRGTAPASLWGGAYYNFGLLGTTVLVLVLAVVINWVSYRFYARPGLLPVSFLEVACLSGMAISLGAWIAGSPLTVLNQGFFAYLALLCFVRARQPWQRLDEKSAAQVDAMGARA